MPEDSRIIASRSLRDGQGGGKGGTSEVSMGHRSPVCAREIGIGGAKTARRSRRSCLPGRGVSLQSVLHFRTALTAAAWLPGRLLGDNQSGSTDAFRQSWWEGIVCCLFFVVFFSFDKSSSFTLLFTFILFRVFFIFEFCCTVWSNGAPCCCLHEARQASALMYQGVGGVIL